MMQNRFFGLVQTICVLFIVLRVVLSETIDATSAGPVTKASESRSVLSGYGAHVYVPRTLIDDRFTFGAKW